MRRRIVDYPHHRLLARVVPLALLSSLFAQAPTVSASRPYTGPVMIEGRHQDVEALSADAIEAYKRGALFRAIVLFEHARAYSGNPNFLFNIARVYEELGALDQALEHYTRFVESPRVSIKDRTKGTRRLRVLRLALEEASASREL